LTKKGNKTINLPVQNGQAGGFTVWNNFPEDLPAARREGLCLAAVPHKKRGFVDLKTSR